MGDITPAGGTEDGCDSGGGWRKSSYSMSNGQCVEVAVLEPGLSEGSVIGVRDSRSMVSVGPVLCFGRRAWSGFLAEVRAEPSSAN